MRRGQDFGIPVRMMYIDTKYFQLQAGSMILGFGIQGLGLGITVSSGVPDFLREGSSACCYACSLSCSAHVVGVNNPQIHSPFGAGYQCWRTPLTSTALFRATQSWQRRGQRDWVD